jgi:hypothetical protein
MPWGDRMHWWPQPSSRMARYMTEQQVVEAQVSALAKHLGRSSVCLIGSDKSGPHEAASGTCICLGGRFFIATAAHFLKAYPDSDVFVVSSSTPSRNRTPFLHRGSVGGESDDRVDVAFLELDAADAKALGKQFIDSSRLHLGFSSASTDSLVVHGFPTESMDRTRFAENILGVEPLGYVTRAIDVSAVQHSKVKLDPHYDVCLEYPRGGNVIIGHPDRALPKAPGISGGGVWVIDMQSPTIWSPDGARLIAIEHEWREYEYLRGTLIRHWVELVGSELPELRWFPERECVRTTLAYPPARWI